MTDEIRSLTERNLSLETALSFLSKKVRKLQITKHQAAVKIQRFWRRKLLDLHRSRNGGVCVYMNDYKYINFIKYFRKYLKYGFISKHIRTAECYINGISYSPNGKLYQQTYLLQRAWSEFMGCVEIYGKYESAYLWINGTRVEYNPNYWWHSFTGGDGTRLDVSTKDFNGIRVEYTLYHLSSPKWIINMEKQLLKQPPVFGKYYFVYSLTNRIRNNGFHLDILTDPPRYAPWNPTDHNKFNEPQRKAVRDMLMVYTRSTLLTNVPWDIIELMMDFITVNERN